MLQYFTVMQFSRFESAAEYRICARLNFDKNGFRERTFYVEGGGEMGMAPDWTKSIFNTRFLSLNNSYIHHSGFL